MTAVVKAMTPEEYGRHLARRLPPITDKQADDAAKIIAASWLREQHARKERAA
ncbi:MAG: hypothetical protein ACRDG7_10000 [Candidatus Limnocylindria bacterium]